MLLALSVIPKARLAPNLIQLFMMVYDYLILLSEIFTE